MTGVFIDGGRLEAGGFFSESVSREISDFRITDGEVVTLLFKAKSGDDGSLVDIFFKWAEKW